MKVLELSWSVPVELPILVLAVPVVLMLVAPKTLVVEAELPMATVPVLVPVFMLVPKLDDALMLVLAPEIAAPPVIVASPEALIVVMPLRAPAVVTFKAEEAKAKVPVALPMLVFDVPVVLIATVPVSVRPPVPCNNPEPEFTPTAVTDPALVTPKLVDVIRLVKVPLRLMPLVAVPAELVKLSRLVVVPPAPLRSISRPLVWVPVVFVNEIDSPEPVELEVTVSPVAAPA